MQWVPGVVRSIVHVELSGWSWVVGKRGGGSRHSGSWEQCRRGVQSCCISGNECWGGLESGIGRRREA